MKKSIFAIAALATGMAFAACGNTGKGGDADSTKNDAQQNTEEVKKDGDCCKEAKSSDECCGEAKDGLCDEYNKGKDAVENAIEKGQKTVENAQKTVDQVKQDVNQVKKDAENVKNAAEQLRKSIQN